MLKSGKLLLSLLAALLLASGQPAPPPAGSAPACSIPPPSPGSLPEALVHPADATEQTPGSESGYFREVTTILSNAPCARAVDIVITGDGYTLPDLAHGGSFDVHAGQFIRTFFSEAPFSELKPLCNVHLVRAVSHETGADRSQHEDTRDTAFDAAYGAYGIDRLLVIRRPEKLRRTVLLAPAQDIVVVLVNDARYGGSGSMIPAGTRSIPAPVYAAGNPNGIRIALHELGHSLANLADEYVDESIAAHYSLAYVRDKPNVDTTSDLGRIKWKAFFEAEPGATNVISAWEGGYYRSRGIWRPQEHCIMRSLSHPFCHVCRKELCRAVYRIAGRLFDEAGYHREHPVLREP